jgi:hypothetical protein
MPVYFCGICEYTTESKSSMDRHRARNTPCTTVERQKKEKEKEKTPQD